MLQTAQQTDSGRALLAPLGLEHLTGSGEGGTDWAAIETALIDKILATPEHAWFNRPTAEIKKDIKAGKLQELYRGYFKAER